MNSIYFILPSTLNSDYHYYYCFFLSFPFLFFQLPPSPPTKNNLLYILLPFSSHHFNNYLQYTTIIYNYRNVLYISNKNIQSSNIIIYHYISKYRYIVFVQEDLVQSDSGSLSAVKNDLFSCSTKFLKTSNFLIGSFFQR